MTEYYIAWNENKTEGFISADKSDVLKALGRLHHGGFESTLGAQFRDSYSDQTLPRIQKIEVKK